MKCPCWRSLLALSLLAFGLSEACSSSSQSEYDEFKIMRKTEKNQLVVGVDEDARLYCQTNVPWKKCVWKPPRNGVREVGSAFSN